MDCAGDERRAQGGKGSARMAEDETQPGDEQRVVDFRTRGWEGRRPIYDELLRLGKSMGEDVKACPSKTMVPFYREHVFAQIKPTTNTRIDLGFALARYQRNLPKRVIDTCGLANKDRITHRIELKSVAKIDAEVKKWLKMAYELDAK
jgi:hypothetical protein